MKPRISEKAKKAHKRKGWSNESQEAAQRHAHERAQIALQEVLNHPTS